MLLNLQYCIWQYLKAYTRDIVYATYTSSFCWCDNRSWCRMLLVACPIISPHSKCCVTKAFAVDAPLVPLIFHRRQDFVCTLYRPKQEIVYAETIEKPLFLSNTIVGIGSSCREVCGHCHFRKASASCSHGVQYVRKVSLCKCSR